ncbi:MULTISPECIES: hypothetical protein [Paenibacillus]|uniref:hypothetical protein n=1 Tax=Paenibacillus TaxID=44249 RepID=UPI0022B8D41C|nr:hypothetical protein [Paenibacillus caseinilyticus]MCZ8521849.1 hypothetical protein [Paenibacillus caseinilyticus]
MEDPRVIIFASYEEMESVYAPLNTAVTEATTGAKVILALSCRGAALLNYGSSSAITVQEQIPLSSIMILKQLAIQYGVTFVVPYSDCNEEYKDIPIKKVSLDWMDKVATTAKLVVRV